MTKVTIPVECPYCAGEGTIFDDLMGGVTCRNCMGVGHLEQQLRHERIESLGLKAYDEALPQSWVDQISAEHGFDVRGHFVWSYDTDGARTSNIFGHPVPVTAKGSWMAGQMLCRGRDYYSI